jgi:hypothetical protein
LASGNSAEHASETGLLSPVSENGGHRRLVELLFPADFEFLGLFILHVGRGWHFIGRRLGCCWQEVNAAHPTASALDPASIDQSLLSSPVFLCGLSFRQQAPKLLARQSPPSFFQRSNNIGFHGGPPRIGKAYRYRSGITSDGGDGR